MPPTEYAFTVDAEVWALTGPYRSQVGTVTWREVSTGTPIYGVEHKISGVGTVERIYDETELAEASV